MIQKVYAWMPNITVFWLPAKDLPSKTIPFEQFLPSISNQPQGLIDLYSRLIAGSLWMNPPIDFILQGSRYTLKPMTSTLSGLKTSRWSFAMGWMATGKELGSWISITFSNLKASHSSTQANWWSAAKAKKAKKPGSWHLQETINPNRSFQKYF